MVLTSRDGQTVTCPEDTRSDVHNDHKTHRHTDVVSTRHRHTDNVSVRHRHTDVVSTRHQHTDNVHKTDVHIIILCHIDTLVSLVEAFIILMSPHCHWLHISEATEDIFMKTLICTF